MRRHKTRRTKWGAWVTRYLNRTETDLVTDKWRH